MVVLLAELKPAGLIPFLKSAGGNLERQLVERALKEINQWNAMATMQAAAGDVKAALDIWRKMGKGEVKDSNFNGIQETIDCLRGYAPKDVDGSITLEYATWVLEKDMEEGLKIFLPPAPARKLPDQKIVDFLEKKNCTASRRYLEFICFEAKPKEGQFYTKLATIYLAGIANGDQSLRAKLVQLLKVQGVPITGAAQAVLSALTIDVHPKLKDLQEEKAAALERLDRHEEALKIIVDLKNYQKAEEYCVTVRDPPTPSKTLLLMLLKIYLTIEHPITPGELSPRVKELLLKHSQFFDPTEILSLLPVTIHLQEIMPFLERAFHDTTYQHRAGQIVRGLQRTVNFTVKCEATKLTSKRFIVDETTLCCSCQKQLGCNVFARHPVMGTLMCFRCYEKWKNSQ